MKKCEDFPCCGHELGDCPDGQERLSCIDCGKKLPRRATSSICDKCQKRMGDAYWNSQGS